MFSFYRRLPNITSESYLHDYITDETDYDFIERRDKENSVLNPVSSLMSRFRIIRRMITFWMSQAETLEPFTKIAWIKMLGFIFP